MRLILVLLFSVNVFGVTAQSGSWQYFFPSTQATALAAKGNTILAGTSAFGLLRLDTLGNRQYFHPSNSGIPSADIRQVAIDAAGHWWIHYPAGFARFDGANWQTWTLAQAGLPAAASVKTLKAGPGGSMYAGTAANGVAIFQAGAWSVLDMANSGLPANDIREVTVDAGGKTYFATGAGLAIRDGANWTVYNAANTGLSNMNNVKSVAVTAAGTIWVTEGLTRFARFEAGVWTEYVTGDVGLGAAGFSGKVLVDQSDRLWLTFSKSVSVFAAGVWTHYSEAELGCTLPVNLQVNSVTIAQDGAGRIWATACDLVRLVGQNWSRPGTGNSGLPGGQVYGIAQDTSGAMWFGAEAGIARLDGNDAWSAYAPVDLGATDDYVFDALGASDGSAWLGLNNSELLRFDGANWTLFDTCATPFPGFFVRVAAEAPNGDLWFSIAPTSGFSARLARYVNGAWTFFTPTNSPLPTNADVSAIVFSVDGTAWFGTATQGLRRFDGVNWSAITITNSNLPSNAIRGLAIAPNGALWAATDAGIARLDGTNWTTLNTANSGLPSNNTSRIAFDMAGGMYVGHEATPAGAKCSELRNGIWTQLIPPAIETVNPYPPYALIVDRDNRLWYACADYANFSGNVVYRYDPKLVSAPEDTAPAPRFFVFPNPATDYIFLDIQPAVSGEARLQISNAQGRPVYANVLSDTAGGPVRVQVGHLPAGLYMATLFQGDARSTVKLVKM